MAESGPTGLAGLLSLRAPSLGASPTTTGWLEPGTPQLAAGTAASATVMAATRARSTRRITTRPSPRRGPFHPGALSPAQPGLAGPAPVPGPAVSRPVPCQRGPAG